MVEGSVLKQNDEVFKSVELSMKHNSEMLTLVFNRSAEQQQNIKKRLFIGYFGEFTVRKGGGYAPLGSIVMILGSN